MYIVHCTIYWYSRENGGLFDAGRSLQRRGADHRLPEIMTQVCSATIQTQVVATLQLLHCNYCNYCNATIATTVLQLFKLLFLN